MKIAHGRVGQRGNFRQTMKFRNSYYFHIVAGTSQWMMFRGHSCFKMKSYKIEFTLLKFKAMELSA